MWGGCCTPPWCRGGWWDIPLSPVLLLFLGKAGKQSLLKSQPMGLWKEQQ